MRQTRQFDGLAGGDGLEHPGRTGGIARLQTRRGGGDRRFHRRLRPSCGGDDAEHECC